MMEAIRGDVLTSQRLAKKDVVMFTTEKGGVQFRALSYLDVLLENDVITESQYQCGQAFWAHRDCAFDFLQLRISRYDYTAEDHDNMLEAITENGFTERGLSTEIYLSLARKMQRLDRETVSASCQPLKCAHLSKKMAIIWAFGENALERAFANLEIIMPCAVKEAEQRMKNSCAVD